MPQRPRNSQPSAPRSKPQHAPPTPDDDSFFVSAYAGEYPRKNSRNGTILKPTVWPTGVTKSLWKWRQFKTELPLPVGPVVLTLHAREDGTKIDRLFLTSDPSQDPAAILAAH